MSEAFGSVVLKAPQDLLDAIADEADEISIATMDALFKQAGIENFRKSHDMLAYVGDALYSEGIESADGLLCINIFGEEWMWVMEALTQQGNYIEAYGVIDHEHGARGYYALNNKGECYSEVVDYEGDYNTDREPEIQEKWLSMVSASARSTFPECFSFENSDDEDYDDD